MQLRRKKYILAMNRILIYLLKMDSVYSENILNWVSIESRKYVHEWALISRDGENAVDTDF